MIVFRSGIVRGVSTAANSLADAGCFWYYYSQCDTGRQWGLKVD